MPTQPPVALVMGSDSDLPKLERTLATLQELSIPCEVRIISAHRTPDSLREWLDGAIPVIGIPVVGGALNGLDALLSTVNMPGGVPVATVGLGGAGAANAALLAAQILGVGDAAIAERVAAKRAADSEQVRAKDAKVRADHPPA